MDTTDQLASELWDSLRDIACVTGRKATRIIMLTESDIRKALKRLSEQPPQCQPTTSPT